METPYPKVERDTLDKISNCVSEYGPDYLHEKDIPQGPTEPAASPTATPKSPEGLK